MITFETTIAFLIASILLALAPGPDNIFVLTQSAIYGKSAGIVVMLGLCTGLVVHSIAVAFGVSVVFQTSAIAFSVLKFVGACYLLYLAWQAFSVPVTKNQSVATGEVNRWRLYRRGILMNITNPKVSIFFLAFLPQFADPSRGAIWLQLLLLGALFILATILVFGSIAFLAGALGQLLNRSDHVQKFLNKVAGTIFLGLALKLVTTEK